MSTSKISGPTSSKAGPSKRAKWLICIANALVIALGICSGYSLAMGHREAMKAAEVIDKAVVQAPALPIRPAPCEAGRVVAQSSR